MSAACGEACGHCGGCTAAWERESEDDDDTTEVCPDCLGWGEIEREDGSDLRVIATCLECDGRGWID